MSGVEHTLLQRIKSCSDPSQLRQLHAHLLRTSLFHLPAVSTSFLNQTAALHYPFAYTRRVFSHIGKPNIYHFNTMLKACSANGCPDEAMRLYRDMGRAGVSPNEFSMSFVVKACGRVGSVLGGRQVHGCVVRSGYGADVLLVTALMSLYAGCGAFGDAGKMFEEMPRKDTVSWNVLISCYLSGRRMKDALGLFDEMLAEGNGCCRPDDVTCLLLLQTCSQLGALEFGERIRCYADDNGYSGSVKVCNSLVDMYCNCGSLDKAIEVFRGMKDRNVVSWSTLISGLAMNGYGRDSLNAFSEMCSSGVLPDSQTFTGVLSACSHSGLKAEGIRYFKLMRTEFGISPNLYHYSCMVDLLGRAGLLDEAYNLVMSMEVKPDALIWRTLLGACRIYDYLSLGERVIAHLIDLNADEPGDYVLLLNIYASCKNWEKVATVRKLMKDKGMQTMPGCSNFELNGKLHEFVVDDDSHPKTKEIYNMLHEIEGQLKFAGYVVNIASELHNVDATQKENILSYHSEKLAIAFGILSTPPGTTLRISKNLRICTDCHNFAKVLSGVYNRKLIVRDRIRFHHFQNGSCSCNDYW